MATVAKDTADLLARGGGKPGNLHRIMANQPEVLDAWVRFNSALKASWHLSAALRELMILRIALTLQSEFLWHHHQGAALRSGVRQDQIDQLRNWRQGAAFSEVEQAALALVDEMASGHLRDITVEKLAQHFDAPSVVQMVGTAAYWLMVPRVLDALRVPLDDPSSSPQRASSPQ
jgi:alkylhydroperoxidase family enzyme